MKEPKWSRGNYATDWPVCGVPVTRHEEIDTPCETSVRKRRLCRNKTHYCENCTKQITACNRDQHEKWHNR